MINQNIKDDSTSIAKRVVERKSLRKRNDRRQNAGKDFAELRRIRTRERRARYAARIQKRDEREAHRSMLRTKRLKAQRDRSAASAAKKRRVSKRSCVARVSKNRRAAHSQSRCQQNGKRSAHARTKSRVEDERVIKRDSSIAKGVKPVLCDSADDSCRDYKSDIESAVVKSVEFPSRDDSDDSCSEYKSDATFVPFEISDEESDASEASYGRGQGYHKLLKKRKC